jgi:hypothetical protein
MDERIRLVYWFIGLLVYWFIGCKVGVVLRRKWKKKNLGTIALCEVVLIK